MSVAADLSQRFEQMSSHRSRAIDGDERQRYSYDVGGITSTAAPLYPQQRHYNNNNFPNNNTDSSNIIASSSNSFGAPLAAAPTTTSSVSVATSPMHHTIPLHHTHQVRTYTPLEERTILIGGGDGGLGLGTHAARNSYSMTPTTATTHQQQQPNYYSGGDDQQGNGHYHYAQDRQQQQENSSGPLRAPLYRSTSVVSNPTQDDAITTVVEQKGYVVRKNFVPNDSVSDSGGDGRDFYGGDSYRYGGGLSEADADNDGEGRATRRPLSATVAFGNTASNAAAAVGHRGDDDGTGGDDGHGNTNLFQQRDGRSMEGNYVDEEDRYAPDSALIGAGAGGEALAFRYNPSSSPSFNKNKAAAHIGRSGSVLSTEEKVIEQAVITSQLNPLSDRRSVSPPLNYGGRLSVGAIPLGGHLSPPRGLGIGSVGLSTFGGNAAVTAAPPPLPSSVTIGQSTNTPLNIHDNFAAQRHPYGASSLIDGAIGPLGGVEGGLVGGGGHLRLTGGRSGGGFTGGLLPPPPPPLSSSLHGLITSPREASASLPLPSRSVTITTIGSNNVLGAGGLGMGGVGDVPSFYRGSVISPRSAASHSTTAPLTSSSSFSARGPSVTPLTDALASRLTRSARDMPLMPSRANDDAPHHNHHHHRLYQAPLPLQHPVPSHHRRDLFSNDDEGRRALAPRASTSKSANRALVGFREPSPSSSEVRGGEEEQQRHLVPYSGDTKTMAVAVVGASDPFGKKHESINLIDAMAAAEAPAVAFPAAANPMHQTIAPFNGLMVPIPTHLMGALGAGEEVDFSRIDAVMRRQVDASVCSLSRALNGGGIAAGDDDAENDALSLLQRIVMRCRVLRKEGAGAASGKGRSSAAAAASRLDLSYAPLPPHPLLEEAFHKTLRNGTMMALYSVGGEGPLVRCLRIDIKAPPPDSNSRAAVVGSGEGAVVGMPLLVWSKARDSPVMSGSAPLWDLMEVSTSIEACPVLLRYLANEREDVPARRVGGHGGRSILGPRLGGSRNCTLPPRNTVRMLFANGMELVWVALEQGVADAWVSALHYIAVESMA